MNTYYFTVATKPHPGLEILKTTCHHHNLNLNILGMNDTRLQEWGDNLWVKLDYLKTVLNTINDKNTAILFTDAYDVICTGGMDDIITKFKTLQSPIVFSAERQCFPITFKEQYIKCGCTPNLKSFPYLNSGAFIGYVWAFQEMFDNMSDYKTIGNDQTFCQYAFFKLPHLIKLDHNASIFVCAVDVPISDFKMKNGKCKYANSFVNFVHVNGPKDILNPLFNQWKQSITNHKNLQYIFMGVIILIFLLLFKLQRKEKSLQ